VGGRRAEKKKTTQRRKERREAQRRSNYQMRVTETALIGYGVTALAIKTESSWQ